MSTIPPYRSQHDADANKYHGDCGEACLAMAFETLGKGRIDIDALSNQTGLKDGKTATTISEMLGLCAAYSITAWRKTVQTIGELRTLLANGGYFIPLIEYAYIPDRLDTGYKIGHFVLIYDVQGTDVIWHDPDWWEPFRSLGAGRRYAWSVFEKAFKNTESPYTGIWIPGVQPMSDVDRFVAFVSAATAPFTLSVAGQTFTLDPQDLKRLVPQPAQKKIVTAATLNVRAAPGQDIVRQVKSGDTVFIDPASTKKAVVSGVEYEFVNLAEWVAVQYLKNPQ